MRLVQKITGWLLLVVAVIYLFVVGLSYLLTVRKDTNTGWNSFDWRVKKGYIDTAWYNSKVHEDLSILSPYGYSLSGTLLQGSDSAKYTVILCHGIKADRWSTLKFAELYAPGEFNVIMYDHTRHGLSEGGKLGYGFYEKNDLDNVVRYAKKRFPHTKLILHGESLGGATVLQHLTLNEEHKLVDYYIADCPFSDLTTLFKTRMEQDFGIPDWGVVAMTSWLASIIDGYSFSEVSPINSVRNSSTPILFLHGDEDYYVPTIMSVEMQAVRSNTRLVLIEGAGHGVLFRTNKDLYRKSVMEFIETTKANR